MFEMVAIGGDGGVGVVRPHGIGHLDMLADADFDIARHGAGDAPHVEADVVEPLRHGGQQMVAGGDVERLVELDVEQPERHGVVIESAAIDGVLVDARPLLGRGALGAAPHQFEIDHRARLEMLVHVVLAARR